MNQMQKRRLRTPSIILGAVLALAAGWLVGCGDSESPGQDAPPTSEAAPPPPAAAEFEPAGPTRCDQEYALCIAASCNATGTCGVKPGTTTPCDQAGVLAGTCGACFVFDGESDYFPDQDRPSKTCEELAATATTVYSTYSSHLVEDYGFTTDGHTISPDACNAEEVVTADCMGAPCTFNGPEHNIELKSHDGAMTSLRTASCSCDVDVDSDSASYQGLPSTTADCSVIWSVG